MGLFGSFDVRLDPWEAEYSGELSIEAGSLEPAEEVDLSVEQQSDAWTPVLARDWPPPSDDCLYRWSSSGRGTTAGSPR